MYDGEKRAMLNDLTRRTFWFDFEDWVSAEPYDGADDYRLFCRGDRLRGIERDGLFFPLLSHA